VKKFEFNLETVLKYRRHQEKKAQMDLGEARMARKDILCRIDRLVREKDQIHDRLKKDAMEGMTAGWYLACRQFAGRLDQELKTAGTDLKKQEEKIEVLRSCLEKQYIKKESLECLKTTCEQTHKKNVENELQKFSDELVLLRKGGVR
jgi:flagellar protein FliJ